MRYNLTRNIAAIFITLMAPISFAANVLYPGEQLIKVNQYETLIQFTKGDPAKPLVIFVPGDSHLARIAYGYPAGDKKDFLAYWLHERGYSFLGISYPLDNPVFTRHYPAFSIQDWGKQIASAAAQIIRNNHLGNHIIVAGWSMGGSVEEAVNAAAKHSGLTVDAFIGLAAVPPLPYIMQSGPYTANKILPNKLADRAPLTAIFTKLIEEQNQYNQHTVLPRDIYLKEFLGNIPAALTAEGYHYRNGKFVHDINAALTDSGVYNFADTPWIALIRDDAQSTAKLSLIDPASWNFIRAEMIYKNYLGKHDLTKLSAEKWQGLFKLVNDLPDNLTLTVHGNHFFFVGEKGAKATADKIEELAARVSQIKTELEQI